MLRRLFVPSLCNVSIGDRHGQKVGENYDEVFVSDFGSVEHPPWSLYGLTVR